MIKVKVTTIGNSVGFVLPKEAVNRLKAQKGDTLYLVEDSDGYLLTPFRVDFEKQVEAAESAVREYRNTLRELAK